MQQLTKDQIDALQELINIGVGRAASLLNEMVESRIILSVPFVNVFNAVELKQELAKRFSEGSFAAVRLRFTGSFCGNANLIFPTESAATLVAILTGEQPGTPDLDAVKIGTLNEIGNIVINAVMGSISNLIKQHLNYYVPMYLEDCIENLLFKDNLNVEKIYMLAQASFAIENLEIIGEIILIFEMHSFDALIEAINHELEVEV
ncbi:MAG: chemotaxis protein CheC [Stigonema ocellatum SAG 48.90 = DSM 106950]|nr:chemotaxis protein CheC [Stigonema ocellatum SAG 48.90 = DSM 106950]